MSEDNFYILDGKTPVPVDLETWGKWYQGADRQVDLDDVEDARVSTVFIGFDHKFDVGDGPPLIFETMIFGGDHDEYCARCSTWEQAEDMHQQAINLITT